MRVFITLVAALLLLGGCSHLTRLDGGGITGKRNFIFIRPFSGGDAPDEASKLISESFYKELTAADLFSDSGKIYDFDFYYGQPCPEGYDCYYITGKIVDYRYEKGCCGKDGVEMTAKIRFWNDMTKKPLFEISEWNNEVFDPEETDRLQAIQWLADDTADVLIDALLKELSGN